MPLQDIRSGVFRLHEELLRRFAPDEHLELCRANLDRDWHRALPVMKDLVAREEHAEVDAIAKRVIASWRPRWLSSTEHKEFDVEADLLVAFNGRLSDDESASELLEIWAQTARATERVELAATLDLQRLALTSWQDWDEMIAAFNAASESGFAELSDRLFLAWRHMVSTESHGSPRPKVSWVDHLADAARLGWEAPAFHRRLRAWLEDASRSREAMTAHQTALKNLTNDLDRGEMEAASPTYAKQISTPGSYFQADRRKQLRASRRLWLERLNAAELLPDLIECWRGGVAFLVPDPRTARQSRYESQALWLQVVFELNRSDYQAILAQWRKEHPRKTNLWAAIRAQGLKV